ncbi:MAG: carboxymuconolactone decarboxylase family protein [Nitrospinota bacterium]
MATKTKAKPQYDPAVVELRKASPVATGNLIRIREEAYKDDRIPGKYKVLMALTISTAIKCEPCVEMYAEKALKMGVGKEELVEALNVTMAMAGCPGEAWAHKALRAYNRHAAGGTSPEPAPEEPAACCPPE